MNRISWKWRSRKWQSLFRRTLSTSNCHQFHGVYPIVVTPFRNDTAESLDLESLRRSLVFLLQSGVCRGVTITGVLGESNRLLDSEREQLIVCAKKELQQRHDFHLCVGTSYSGTAATVALSQMAQELGANSVMVTPSKDGSSENDIIELYRRVAESCPDVDIVLQDHPSSTGVNMSLELIRTIAMQVPAVKCIKLESLPTVQRLASLSPHLLSQCSVLTGLGALYAAYDLESAIPSGFMTGFAFPEILHQMNQYAQTKQYQKVYALYRKFLPLIVLEQTPGAGLAIRKEIYKLRGLIDSAHVRHPGKNISKTLQKVLHTELTRSLPGIDLTKPLPQELLQVPSS